MIVKIAELGVLLLLAASVASAQGKPARPISGPRFRDYPAAEIFTGTPAAPLVEEPPYRQFRTAIRQGVSTGLNVFHHGEEQSGPNFAGHYYIVEWGCGSSCVMMVVVDALTGKVYDPPLTSGDGGINKMVLPRFGLLSAEVDFRQASRLLTMAACPDSMKKPHAPCYRYFFLWQENEWRLLNRIQLDDSPL